MAASCSQYDKDDVEAVGLVKFDFLGLTTLTILDWAVRYIRRLDPAKADWSAGAGCRSTTRRRSTILDEGQNGRRVPAGKPRHAGHAEGCAARPLRGHHRAGGAVPSGSDGPDSELLRAQARPRELSSIPIRVSKSVLKETYGIMVYQEQVMQMAQIIGGYSLGGADLLRRAMGKKKAEEMAEHRELFREGAAKNGLTGREGRRNLRPDGEVRGLRLQQVARGRVCAARRTTPRG